jgi:hypothetical protein
MSKLTTEQLFRRLRLNPVICMDGVNITDLAIATIEEQDRAIGELATGLDSLFCAIEQSNVAIEGKADWLDESFETARTLLAKHSKDNRESSE